MSKHSRVARGSTVDAQQAGVAGSLPPATHEDAGTPETRSGDELVEVLRRWEAFGAVWRVLGRDPAQVTIGLFRCDAGEEVGRLVSGAPELLSFLDDRGPRGPVG